MEEYVRVTQTERQMMIYDAFCTLEEVKICDLKWAMRKIEIRTLQRDLRDLKAAGLLNVRFSKERDAYVWVGEPTGKISVDASISQKKREHLQRLQRIAACMDMVEAENPVELYFQMFPEASERMRQRDFSTLNVIGYEAGYDKEWEAYSISHDYFGAYDGYDVFVRDGQLVRWRS